MGQAGAAKIQDGMGQDSQNPTQDVGQNGRENDALKQDIWSYFEIF